MLIFQHKWKFCIYCFCFSNIYYDDLFAEFPGGKRQTLTFTPRLGRELDAAEVLSAVSSSGIRSPPFSPRLGRGNGLPFSPRLGRQQELSSTRVGRSAPDPRPTSKSSEHH